MSLKKFLRFILGCLFFDDRFRRNGPEMHSVRKGNVFLRFRTILPRISSHQSELIPDGKMGIKHEMKNFWWLVASFDVDKTDLQLETVTSLHLCISFG